MCLITVYQLTLTYVEFTESLTATEISNLANSLLELDYSELIDLCSAMGVFEPELRVLQGIERTHLILQVVTKWQSISPQNTKHRLAEILLQNGYYVQALRLDAKCMLLHSIHNSLISKFFPCTCSLHVGEPENEGVCIHVCCMYLWTYICKYVCFMKACMYVCLYVCIYAS